MSDEDLCQEGQQPIHRSQGKTCIYMRRSLGSNPSVIKVIFCVHTLLCMAIYTHQSQQQNHLPVKGITLIISVQRYLSRGGT